MTRVLALCGAALPDALLQPNYGNPTGYWEPQDALDLNEEFLRRHGSAWSDPSLRLQDDDGVVDPQEGEAYRARIAALLEAYEGNGKPVVVKEPRITGLSRFWFDAAARCGYEVLIVVPVRHPREVAASLAARDGTSFELASVLWLKYNLLAERDSRAYPRVFVEYSSLLADWRTQVSRIAHALKLDLAGADAAAIDAFLDPALYQHRSANGALRAPAWPWMETVYMMLSAAARDVPVNTSEMDRVFRSFTTCERFFRVSFAAPQSTEKPSEAT